MTFFHTAPERWPNSYHLPLLSCSSGDASFDFWCLTQKRSACNRHAYQDRSLALLYSESCFYWNLLTVLGYCIDLFLSHKMHSEKAGSFKEVSLKRVPLYLNCQEENGWTHIYQVAPLSLPLVQKDRERERERERAEEERKKARRKERFCWGTSLCLWSEPKTTPDQVSLDRPKPVPSGWI